MTEFNHGFLAPDLVLIPDKTYAGPGKRYRTNLLDIMRDVTTPATDIDLLIGKK